MNTTIRQIKDVLEGLGSQHKKIHMSVSKLGKTIEKNFCRETQASNEEDFFINLSETNKFTLKNQQDDDQMDDDFELRSDKLINNKSTNLTPSKQIKLINKAILQHFLRVGHSEVANELINEGLLILNNYYLIINLIIYLIFIFHNKLV